VKFNDIIERVDEEWREQFTRFIETGEADEPFLNHLDASEACQRAVDEAITAQGVAFAGLASALDGTSEPLKRREAAAASLACGLESVMELPEDERPDAISGALAAVRLLTKGLKKQELMAAVEQLDEEVSQG